MDADQYLQHLQDQYPGQFVLYPSDLAKILGKTEKALAHLIYRGRIPFEMKTLGGRKVAGIYQVAEWLAGLSDESLAPGREEQGSSTVGSGPKSSVSSARPRGSKSGIGARLMEMRHEAALSLSRIGLTIDADDAPFLNELIERLLTHPGVPDSNWTVKCVRWRHTDTTTLREETSIYCETRESARLAIEDCQRSVAGGMHATIFAKRGTRSVIFRAYCLDGGSWQVVVDLLHS